MITLIVLGGGIAAGVLTSRLMQGRSIRELQDDTKEIQQWRQEATQQLNDLITQRQIDREVKAALAQSSQSTTHGTRPYPKAQR